MHRNLHIHQPVITVAVSRGFTLIEVAIALLVLAVGLLGIAGIQSVGMQASQESQLRSVAMNQAQDLAERIRANVSGFRAQSYDISIPSSEPSPNCSASSSSCTTAQLAAADLYNWNSNNSGLLPSGQGSIACTDVNAASTPAIYDEGSSCVITVRWDNERTGATGTGCNPNNTSDLTCLRMRVMP